MRFDFSLTRAREKMCVCEETDEIVCQRLVEIDRREVSVFRQLYANVDGTFRLKIQIVSNSFVRQRTTGSILVSYFLRTLASSD